MKFYKVKTPHTQDEIDKIILSMTIPETESILKLYNQISMVEFTDETGNECMFVIANNYLLSELDKIYKKYSINYSVFDITNEIIYDNEIKTKYKNQNGRLVQKDILNLILEYKQNWVTKDDILDKIIEKGIDSLTKLDIQILKS